MEPAPVEDQWRLVLTALDANDRLALSALLALAVGATGAVVVECASAQEGVEEVQRGRAAGALPVLLLGSQAGERELVRLARLLGNRGGTVPIVLFAPAAPELLAEVALAEGFSDVLVRTRISSDALVRALRSAFEVARRVRAEERLHRLGESEKERSADAEIFAEARRFAALGRTVSAITHDLNNLLQPVLGYSEMLSGSLGAGSRTRRYAEQIERSARLAIGLLGQVLPTVRDRGERPETVLADERLRSVEELLRTLAGRLELVLLTAAPEARVVLRPGALEQILLNLVANGRDAMPGGGRLEIRTAVDADGRWCLEVEDSGVGIPADHITRLLEAGFSTKPSGQGGGLGLWIVRSLVEEAGGQVEVHSAEGRGTLVRVRLPVEEGAASR